MAQDDKQTKFARLAPKSTPLGRVLKELKKRYKEAGAPAELAIPYVLTCAAYLEAKLNDELLMTARERYGEDVAEALMCLSLPAKLNVIVPILTEGRYRINKEHLVFQRLSSLIRVRNRLAHARTKLETVDVGPVDLVTVPFITSGSSEIPRQFFDKEDLALGATKEFTPLDYHDAVDMLEKEFFRRSPDRLARVAMVIDRSKDKGWKRVSAIMCLDLSD